MLCLHEILARPQRAWDDGAGAAAGAVAGHGRPGEAALPAQHRHSGAARAASGAVVAAPGTQGLLPPARILP